MEKINADVKYTKIDLNLGIGNKIIKILRSIQSNKNGIIIFK